MMKVGIVGTSGYAGAELLRLLCSHPQAEVVYVASTSKVGMQVEDVLPSLGGFVDLTFQPVDADVMGEACDVVFTATPHGAAMSLAEGILAAGSVLIDVGADFRFRDAGAYEDWYEVDHVRPDLAAEAAYGIPELFGSDVAAARVIANAGCYPTSALLALSPLVSSGMIDLETVVVCSMSGVSGAGATPKPMYHFPDCVENAQSYGMPGHRHTPEIEEGLARLLGRAVPPLSFTPHLIPMSRGILTHVNARSIGEVNDDTLIDVYRDAYGDAPFVRVLADRLPQTKAVAGSNVCDVAPRYDKRTGRILVASAIDNLVKGAAGQAIQNMNIRFGLEETAGLWSPGLVP